MGVVLFLPFTYQMEVTSAIILLTAMYVSGTYGGAFTSILFRIPGEPIHVPLLWDGYALAKKGPAGKALGWTLVAALIRGLVSATIIGGAPQAGGAVRAALLVSKYFAIVLLGLASVISLGKARSPRRSSACRWGCWSPASARTPSGAAATFEVPDPRRRHRFW